MRLADRVRRSLTQPQSGNGAAHPPDRTELLAQLQREVARIQRRAPPVTVIAPAPQPAARRSVPLPPADDPEGQLYCQTFATGYAFGQARLEPPDAELLARIEGLLQISAAWSPDRQPLAARDLLFLDLETTGLSRSTATLAFLIGTGRWEPEGFRVTQILLGDPAEEPLALDRLQGLLEGVRVLVTFNGRGFDLPLLRNRALVTRSFLDLDRPHLDLLPPCRRLFRPRISNCRLVTLEREILGFAREGDVDGAEIPRIYTEWLRTGAPGELPLVLEHNRLDVALMAPLLHRLALHLTDPMQWAEDGEELLAAGRLHLSRGAAELGEACLVRGLELARLPATRRALLGALARHLRRSGRPDEAVARWEQLRREEPDESAGWIEQAKYHEHVTKDLAAALSLTEACPGQHTDEVQARLARLRRRVERVIAQQTRRAGKPTSSRTRDMG